MQNEPQPKLKPYVISAVVTVAGKFPDQDAAVHALESRLRSAFVGMREEEVWSTEQLAESLVEMHQSNKHAGQCLIDQVDVWPVVASAVKNQEMVEISVPDTSHVEAELTDNMVFLQSANVSVDLPDGIKIVENATGKNFVQSVSEWSAGEIAGQCAAIDLSGKLKTRVNISTDDDFDAMFSDYHKSKDQL